MPVVLAQVVQAPVLLQLPQVPGQGSQLSPSLYRPSPQQVALVSSQERQVVAAPVQEAQGLWQSWHAVPLSKRPAGQQCGSPALPALHDRQVVALPLQVAQGSWQASQLVPLSKKPSGQQ